MKRLTCALLSLTVAALTLCASATASASPITYTEEAVISGTLDGTAFTGETITISWTGDTTGVTFGFGVYLNLAGANAVSFSISNVGSGLLSGTIHVFSNQALGVAGFSDETIFADIIDTMDAAFTSYDLTTAIGPITNTALFNAGAVFSTTAGDLSISDLRDVSTFTATTEVPEPATIGLIGLGVAALVRRQRTARVS